MRIRTSDIVLLQEQWLSDSQLLILDDPNSEFPTTATLGFDCIINAPDASFCNDVRDHTSKLMTALFTQGFVLKELASSL